MPRSLLEIARRDTPVLHVDDKLGAAARLIIDSGMPGLPVVDAEGRVAGIFGEREFIEAAMPGYLQTLHSAVFVKKSLDFALEARGACIDESVGEHMNDEHVELHADFSDLQAAETFLHHRVLLLPVIDEDKRVVGVVLRSDFFRAVAERILPGGEGVGTGEDG